MALVGERFISLVRNQRSPNLMHPLASPPLQPL